MTGLRRRPRITTLEHDQGTEVCRQREARDFLPRCIWSVDLWDLSFGQHSDKPTPSELIEPMGWSTLSSDHNKSSTVASL